MAAVYNITADSIPDLDEWGFDDYWSCNNWIEWHKKMKLVYGLEEANSKFITYFDSQSLGASGIDCRTFDSEFKDYARANGFYDALFSGIGFLAKPLSAGVGVVNTASNVVIGATSGVDSFASWLPYIIGGVLLLILLAIIAYVYSKFKTPKAA